MGCNVSSLSAVKSEMQQQSYGDACTWLPPHNVKLLAVLLVPYSRLDSSTMHCAILCPDYSINMSTASLSLSGTKDAVLMLSKQSEHSIARRNVEESSWQASGDRFWL